MVKKLLMLLLLGYGQFCGAMLSENKATFPDKETFRKIVTLPDGDLVKLAEKDEFLSLGKLIELFAGKTMTAQEIVSAEESFLQLYSGLLKWRCVEGFDSKMKVNEVRVGIDRALELCLEDDFPSVHFDLQYLRVERLQKEWDIFVKEDEDSCSKKRLEYDRNATNGRK